MLWGGSERIEILVGKGAGWNECDVQYWLHLQAGISRINIYIT